MKRYFLIALAIVLILTGFFIIFKLTNFLSPQGKGALQITTNVQATVYLNNKSIGTTPVCLCNPGQTITSGEYSLRISPFDTSMTDFQTRIKINPKVLTAIERTFLPGALASSYTLTLEKISDGNPQLLITSVPDGAVVTIDGNPSSVTPLFQKNITASEHEVEIQKAGFSKKTIRIRTVANYKLIISTILGTEVKGLEDTPSPTPEASPSAIIKIKDTTTGFLRVRETPSVSASEIAKVLPGESYPFLDEAEGWYKIKVASSEGWISSEFSEKIEK